MNKCDKCGFMHYRTDPCRTSKPVAAEPSVTPKPNRPRGRPKSITDMASYKAAKQREYRAKWKARV